MNRRAAILHVLAALFLPAALFAQPASLPRVAIIQTGTPETDRPFRESFAKGMQERGYVDGKNVILEQVYAAGGDQRLPELIADLLRRKPAVLLVGGGQAVQAAKAATSSVPIVVYSMADPVGQGVAASLARPGGNITGIAILSEALVGKRLEILLEVVPKARRVAYLMNPKNPIAEKIFSSAKAAARDRGVVLTEFRASSAAELGEALKAIAKQRPDAVLLTQDTTAYAYRKLIADSLAASRIPAMHGFGEAVVEGALMSYSANLNENRRYAASFVDRILKGAKPGDLPFEQATQMELVVNAKAAKSLGITFPQTVLLRADRVIE